MTQADGGQETSTATRRVRVRGTRLRLLVGATTLGALSLIAAGSALPASAGADDTRDGATIVECRSGIVTDGDVQTSSMVATRVDAAPPELPGVCHVVS